MSNSRDFICKCKRNKGWIVEDEYTTPCLICGRVYKGVYNRKKTTIDPIEIEGSTINIEEFIKNLRIKAKKIIKDYLSNQNISLYFEVYSKFSKYLGYELEKVDIELIQFSADINNDWIAIIKCMNYNLFIYGKLKRKSVNK